MKKCICVFLVVLVVLQPVLSLADGSYFFLKTIMGIQYLSDVEVPKSFDCSTSVQEIGKKCYCMISFPDSWITISGRDLQENYECLLYNNLTMQQLALYSMAICTSYANIDGARTTAPSFEIVIKHGEGDDEMVIINNAEDAETFAKIISDALDYTK